MLLFHRYHKTRSISIILYQYWTEFISWYPYQTNLQSVQKSCVIILIVLIVSSLTPVFFQVWETRSGLYSTQVNWYSWEPLHIRRALAYLLDAQHIHRNQKNLHKMYQKKWYYSSRNKHNDFPHKIYSWDNCCTDICPCKICISIFSFFNFRPSDLINFQLFFPAQ